MKLLARDDRCRPQDADDIRNLLREANEADIVDARRFAELVVARGYHRDRDLVSALHAELREREVSPERG